MSLSTPFIARPIGTTLLTVAVVLAGLRELRIGGDVIVAIDGQKVSSQFDVNLILNHHRPGDTVNVTLYRGESASAIEAEYTITVPNISKPATIATSGASIRSKDACDLRRRCAEGPPKAASARVRATGSGLSSP